MRDAAKTARRAILSVACGARAILPPVPTARAGVPGPYPPQAASGPEAPFRMGGPRPVCRARSRRRAARAPPDKIERMDTENPTPPDDLSRELDAHLAQLGRADSWRVARNLKASAFETTDIVYFEGAAGGELGPYVRKCIDCSAGVGSAYESLWRAQRAGVHLRHVPRLVECVRAGEHLSVVMEYVEGETLDRFVRRVGAGEDVALAVMPQLCDAVSELHARFDPPLIHRDLKPANVIVRDGDRRSGDHRFRHRSHLARGRGGRYGPFRNAGLRPSRAVRIRPDRCAQRRVRPGKAAVLLPDRGGAAPDHR